MLSRLTAVYFTAFFMMVSHLISAQCTIPTNRSESSIGDTEATLTWDAVPDVVTYRVRHRVQNGTWTFHDSATESVEITGLTAGVFYEWQVRTLCGEESTLYSGTRTYQTTGGGACDLPVNLTAGPITDNTADLDWDDATGSTSYRVRYRIQNGTWNAVQVANSDHQLTGLNASTVYEWHIRNNCGATNSGYTDIEDFTTTGDIDCDVPTNFAVGAVTKKTGVVSWDVVPDALEYRIRYKKENDPFTIFDVTGTDTTLQDLVPGKTYSVHVSSICSEDESIRSAPTDYELFDTDECTAPTNISDASITDNSAQVSWDAVSEVDNYKITVVVKGAPSWEDTTTYSSATLSTTLGGLFSGTRYRYEVAAVCDSDEGIETFSASPAGARNQFTTTGVAACGTPSSPSNPTSGDNSVDLTWTAGNNEVNGYEVLYRMVGAPNWEQSIVPASTTSTTISSLEPGRTYQYIVRTRCTADNSLVSTWTSLSNATTTGTNTCTTPANAVTSDTTQFDASLEWDAVGDAVRYHVRYKPLTSSTWLFTGTTGTSMSLSSLSQGTHYHYSVRSICAADTSILSDATELIEFKTEGTNACDRPTGLIVTDVTSSGGLAQWNGQAGAVDYRIRYREANTVFTYATIGSTDTSYSIGGLNPEILHEVQVLSICAPDESVKSLVSKTALFTTSPAAKIAMVEDDQPLEIELSEDEFTVDVYPNPSQGKVFVAINSDAKTRIHLSIINEYGSEVFDYQTSDPNLVEVDLSEYGPGIYTVKVFSKNDLRMERIVVR